MRKTLFLVVTALLATGCGAGLAAVTQPGTAKIELRLIAKNEADGFKVPTWDGKLFMFVEKQAPLTDRDVETVRLAKLPTGAPAINLQLDQTASLALEDITLKNVGRRLAILVDGKIVIAPTIKERITGGSMTVAGFDATQTANIFARIKK